MKALSLAAAAAPLIVALSFPARFQDGPETRDAERAIHRYRDYLSRKPFHEFSFEKMVEGAISKNQLKELVESYENAWKDDATNKSAAIVLARLYTKNDRGEEAVKLLQTLGGDDPQVSKLEGEIHLKRNQYKLAIESLEKATKIKDDPRAAQEVYRLLGKAYLAGGSRQKAIEAFRAVALAEPNNFNIRLEVAASLAQHNLHEEAIVEFNEAEKLAGGDASKRCRVLVEIGKLQEQKIKIDDALATYRQALALMGRGNWLKKDIYNKILSIHKRAGTIDKLLQSCKDEILQQPRDLDLREFLASACEESGRREEARDVLASATREFPDDLKLGRHLITLLSSIGYKDNNAKDKLIEEYQRVLGRHPEEIDLYIELGKIFAEDKRLEQAKIQWEKLFQQKIKDTDLCLRLADLYNFYGMEKEAVAMHEKAIELQPKEIRHYSDLANYYERRERHAEALAVLERAEAITNDSASQLEQLSEAWLELKETKRARAALERALAGRPNDPRLLSTLGSLQLETGDFAAGSQSLQKSINLAEEVNLRVANVDRLLRSAKTNNKIPDLTAGLQAALAAKPNDRAALLILAKRASQARDFAPAMKYYESAIQAEPALEEAHKNLARLYEDQGDFDESLKHYQTIIDKNPQSRRQYLKEMARIYLSLFDQDRAFSLYDEILRAAPDNPAAFKEVAEAYFKINVYDKAAECLQQAVRLKPDEGRYHLDLANIYKKLAEPQKARESILAAMRTGDEEVRNDARKRYYEQLSELGQVEEEIQSLRKRVADNPYDIEAPLLLTDIYIREMEYQLALDMLDSLLTYQPEENKLLTQRARILTLLERHDDAIVSYEKLLKLPKTDREDITLRIAEAAIEAGDVTRAAEVTNSVRNSARVAKLFSKHNLLDQAITALENGVARGGNDPKLHYKLYEQYRRRGDREKAVGCLERILQISGDDVETLQNLGNLYFELGRKDDALECGKRLFSAVRVDMRDDKEIDEQRSSRYNGYGGYYDYDYEDNYSANANNIAQLIGTISNYFNEKNFTKEFAELVAAEARMQPRNVSIVSTAIQQLSSTLQDPAAAAALVDDVKAKTLDAGRLPKNYTSAGWADALQNDIIGIYQNDPKAVDARILQLRERLAAPASEKPLKAIDRERIYIQMAALFDAARKESEAKLLLASAIVELPKSARLHASLATRLDRDKEYDKSVEIYNKLLEIPTDKADEDNLKQQIEIEFRSQRRQIMNQLPVHLRPRITAADTRRIFDARTPPPIYITNEETVPITKNAVRLALSAALCKLNKKAEAREILARVEPRDSDDYYTFLGVANVLFENELFDGIDDYYIKARAVELAQEKDKVLGHVKPARESVAPAMSNYARALEKRGKIFEAYDLLRTYGNVSAGELLLTNSNSFPLAEAEYKKKYDAAAVEHSRDASKENQNALFDAGVRLAEILQFEKRFDDALELYKQLAAKLPEEFEIQTIIAQLYDRADRYEDAVAVHFAALQRKRELNRLFKRNDDPKPSRIVPAPPPKSGAGSDDWIWRNLNYSYGGYGQSKPVQYSVREHYVSILRTYLDRKLVTKAAQVLRDLAREDIATFRWMSWNLVRLIENYNLGAAGIPILRLLYGFEPDDFDTAVTYSRSLVAANQLDEAHRILTLVINKNSGYYYYRDRAAQELAAVEARLGKSRAQSLDELRASVVKDPKNIKQRVKLARRLFNERSYEEAFVHIRDAEKLAPHQEDVRSLYKQCIRVCGELDLVKAEHRKSIQLGHDAEESFGAGLALANIYLEEGDAKAAEAIIEDPRIRAGASSGEFSLSAWWQDRRDYHKSVEILEKELDERGRTKSLMEQVLPRREKLKLILGDLPGALALGVESIDQTNNFGDKEQRFLAFVALFRNYCDLDLMKERVENIIQSTNGNIKHLYRAAYSLALCDHDAADAALAEFIKNDPKAVYLYPTRVTLARSRGDLRKALQLLQELEIVNPGSEVNYVDTSAGGLSERNALRAEKGSLMFKLGEKEAAQKLWLQILDPTKPDDRLTLATIYENHELYDQAIDMVKGYVEKMGERNAEILRRLAFLYVRTNQFSTALEILKKTEILNKGTGDSWYSSGGELVNTYHRAGKLRDYYKLLQEKIVKDPADLDARRDFARVATLLGEDAAAIEALTFVAARPGFEASALPSLAERYQSMGDYSKAIETMEKMLSGNVNKWNRSNSYQKVASLYLMIDQKEKAKEALLKGYDDPRAVASLRGIGGYYISKKMHADALPFFEQARETDPLDDNTLQNLANCYIETGRHTDALDVYFKLLKNPSKAPYLSGFGAAILNAADHAGADANMDKELSELTNPPAASRPADIINKIQELKFRRGFLAYYRAQWKDAIRIFTDLSKELPRDCCIAAALYESLEKDGRFDDAVREGTRLIRLYQQFGNAFDDLRGTASSIVHKNADLLYASGRTKEAVELWEASIRDPFAERDSWNFSINTTPQIPSRAGIELLMRNDYKNAAAKSAESALFGRRGFGNNTYLEAIYRSGEAARAKDILWRTLLDPSRDRGGDGDDYYYNNYGTGSMSNSDLIIKIYAEEGKLDELQSIISTHLQKMPEHTQMKDLRQRALWIEQRFPDLLAEAKKNREKDPTGENFINSEIFYLLKTKKYDEALALAEPRYTRRRASLGNEYEQSTGRTGGAPIRFGWSGGRSYSSGGYYGWSSNSTLTDDPSPAGQLAAIYFKLGKREQALQIEKEIIHRAVGTYHQNTIYESLARWYAEADAVDEMERAAAAAITHNPDSTGEMAMIRIELYDRAKDAAKKKAALDDYYSFMDSRLAKYPSDASLRMNRASVTLQYGDRYSLLLEDAEKLAPRHPHDGMADLYRGWGMLRSGKTAEAVDLFKKSEQTCGRFGIANDSYLYFGLGIALCASDKAQAAPILRRAICYNPVGPLADEARELLK